MLEHKWLALTWEHNDDSVIAMDERGCIPLTNSDGRVLVIQAAEKVKILAQPQSEQKKTVVFHWPPISPILSNLP